MGKSPVEWCRLQLGRRSVPSVTAVVVFVASDALRQHNNRHSWELCGHASRVVPAQSKSYFVVTSALGMPGVSVLMSAVLPTPCLTRHDMSSDFWSPRLARSLLFLSLTLCLSVRLSLTNIASSFFLVLGLSSPWPIYKTLFLHFWFRPRPNAQNLLPKICTKSPITRLVRQINRRRLGLPGFFGDDRFNGTIQNVVGPTLVAMGTTFWLGAEIQSPTGLFKKYLADVH